MLARLEEALQASDGLHKHQYGFRKGVSTMDPVRSIAEELQGGLSTSGRD